MNGAGRDRDLGKEPDRRTGRDQLGIVLLRAVGHQDDRGPPVIGMGKGLAVKLLRKVQTALTAKINVDQCDVRAQLRSAAERLGTAGCRADDRDALALQKVSGSAKELRAVVDDQTAQSHGSRLQGNGAPRIPAAANHVIPTSRHCELALAVMRRNHQRAILS